MNPIDVVAGHKVCNPSGESLMAARVGSAHDVRS